MTGLRFSAVQQVERKRALQTIILSGLTVSESGSAAQSLSLSDILVSSAFVFQAFLDLSAANEACGVRSSLPEVELGRGSVQITVSEGAILVRNWTPGSM